MLKKSLIAIATLLTLTASVSAKQSSTTSVIDNYKGWNWQNVHVAQNDFINLAVVPGAGGRMLEFNLADTPSLWLNPLLLGQSFAQNEEVNGTADWKNFGGMRLIALPRNNVAINPDGTKSERWPPPATLGDSPYTVSLEQNEQGKTTIVAVSGVQELPVPKFHRNPAPARYHHPDEIDEELQYTRTLYIEDDSSLVHITHSLKNVGTKTVERGLMISSQHVTRSQPNITDGENFVAYVPYSPSLRLPSGNQIFRKFNALKETRDVDNGIYTIEYDFARIGGLDIIAAKPWMAYVNKLELAAFVKIIEPYDSAAKYEYGSNMSIFNSNLATGYLESEVKTPLYTLAANESFDFKVIQAAAKILSTPVLDVNRAGIITTRLAYNSSTKTLTGQYGAFKAGDLIVELLTAKEKQISTVKVNPVSPLAGVDFKLVLDQTDNATKARLFIKDRTGQKHLLDTVALN